MTRKATDVLLSIEGMVRQLLNHARNNDMLLKTLSNRINALEGNPQPKQEPNIVTSQQIPGLKPGVVLRKVNDEPNFPDRQMLVKTGQEEPEEEEVNFIEVDNTPVGKRRDARYVVPENVGKPVPVQQKILYPDGRSIPGANVEIFNVNDGKLELVSGAKTSNTGKWTGALPSGNYVIRIYKKETAKYPSVEFQDKLNIPVSSEGVQLKPIQT